MNCEHLWHLHSLAFAGSDELSQYRMSADWHLLLKSYFLLLLVAFHLESAFWYACCQIPLNTPLGIGNVFIKRTGCLAASELSLLLLCSCWASLPFQVSEIVERCCRKTYEVPCDGLSLFVLFLKSKEHPVVSILSLIIHGYPYFLGNTGTPSDCSFKSSPVALLHNKVHLTVDTKTAYTRWKCFSFFGKALTTIIWVPWCQVTSACARAPWLQHCQLGSCCFNSVVTLTSQAGQLDPFTQVGLWSENAWMVLVCVLEQQKFQALDGDNLQSADQSLPWDLSVPSYFTSLMGQAVRCMSSLGATTVLYFVSEALLQVGWRGYPCSVPP